MDNLTQIPSGNGIFIRGPVISNRAKAFKRKDGTGISVVVETEIALQPGVATWVRYFDPKIDTGVKLEGETVTDFPKLKEFAILTIRATKLRSDEHTGQLVIRAGELILNP